MPDKKPSGWIVWPQAVHRASDSRRNLALRCKQNKPALLARRAICYRHSERGWHRLRSRRSALLDPTRSRPAIRELAEAVHLREGPESSRRRVVEVRGRGGIRFAILLIRQL